MKILLADDHGLVRDALKDMLLRDPDADVEVVTVGSLDEALSALPQGPYDAVILDFMMPGMNGVEGVTRMGEAAAPTPVAVISGAFAHDLVERMREAGASGFLPKTLGAAVLTDEILRIAGGEERFTAEPTDPAAEDTTLTKREREVLSYLYKGLQNKEIARELGLREVTVKLHVRSVCRKLDVANRTQAAMRGRELGIPATL